MTHTERRAVRKQDRMAWRTTELVALARPNMSPTRCAGLLVRCGYLIVAVVFFVVRIIEAGVVEPASSL